MVITCSALGLIFAIGVGVAIPITQRSHGPSRLEAAFVEDALVHAANWETKKVSVQCKLTSRNKERISVLGVQTSCGCIRADSLPLELKPGESVFVPFTISLEGFPTTNMGTRVNYTVGFFTSVDTVPVESQFSLVALVPML
jgi:hypothetical protein